MQIPSSILTLVIGMLLVLGGLWVGQSINLLPLDASENAPIYDELFQVLFTIGTILFVGIVGLLVFSLIRFRRRAGQVGDGGAALLSLLAARIRGAHVPRGELEHLQAADDV